MERYSSISSRVQKVKHVDDPNGVCVHGDDYYLLFDWEETRLFVVPCYFGEMGHLYEGNVN